MNTDGKKIIPPETLLEAYSQGIFPMSESRDDGTVGWYSAQQRGIIPMDRFKVSSNVERIIRQSRFKCKVNTRFRDVVTECANRKTTWISELIIDSFEVLYLAGYAHSVEMYNAKGKLAGGLYGVSLGAAFFGESMFKNEKEADKVALWHCHQILEKNGFELWDTQFYTDHLAQFGCTEISADEYQKRLDSAMEKMNKEFKI
ncbi:leucyl/phenylalanyl-tRNA--protein transferase [Rhodohalobacter barkolensis]|uniref:Leucyl/phenylalanyl-tRNA--protein transferase n=1 Tax=Rhodohalobacter barkolensis TaxID=2053187 RepID=A0A2N0VED6_9BACT|nr:leucyl/phenylalanyl-tRNA--protein transferase [Rhodohalobacter barkolensis]PKD42520.1 leucyl/phenylalanyl-tRNA--protein transferase [Rhodohalobacter barkolensis]